MEDELVLVRKRLSNEMINNKLLSDELANVHRYTKQVVAHNELLIKSNKRYEEKWQKMFYTLEYYRDFYRKYIDLITKGKMQAKSSSIVTPRFDNLPNRSNFILPQNPDKDMRNLVRHEADGFQPTIMEAFEHDEGNSARREILNSNNVVHTELNKDQCKAHLLELAKELYINDRLSKTAMTKQMLKRANRNSMQGAPSQGPQKKKRSTSNPLEYVTEGRNYIVSTEISKKEKNGGNIKESKEIVSGIPSFSPLNPTAKDDDFDIDDNVSLGSDTQNQKSPSKMKKPVKRFPHADEGISFTVDAEEFNKNKLVEVSFISNHDILDHIKQDY